MRDLDEATGWLASAKFLYGQEEVGRARLAVIVAQCVHALIWANDALAWRFLRRRATRHEDAARLFGELVRTNKVPPEHAGRRQLLTGAKSEKSEYDYKGRETSKKEARKWIRERERFLEAVRDILPLSRR